MTTEMLAVGFMPPTYAPSVGRAHRGHAPKAQKHIEAREQLKQRFAIQLDRAGYDWEANQLRCCRSTVRSLIAVCSHDPSHHTRALTMTCKLPYCPTCCYYKALDRGRIFEQFTRKAKGKAPDHGLSLLTFTTPFTLHDPNPGDQAKATWNAVTNTLNIAYRTHLAKTGQLTKQDRNKGRLPWKKYHLGLIGAYEYGSEGHRLHYHAGVFGPELDQDFLTETWADQMGQAVYIVNQEPVEWKTPDIQRVLRYIHKLPCDDPQAAPWLVDALKGQRRWRTKGVFHGEASKAPPYRASCPTCNSRIDVIDPKMYALYALPEWEASRRYIPLISRPRRRHA